MIKYKLICKECELSFDSWFASSLEYEKLKKNNFLNCHYCNSKKVDKSLMAPKLINNSDKIISKQKISDVNEIKRKIKKYQKFIKKNFEYVGENFTYEARSIHYNDKKKGKPIYGTASKNEIKELTEEGIQAEMIPWLEDKNN
tara:strand:- start:160 stop:588 length:429 start_codon:yes stop_codon:yes gene_type:complete